MSGGYNAKVVRPNAYKVQTESDGFQTPFFFGGSQIPVGLQLSHKSFNGSGLIISETDPTKNQNRKLVLPNCRWFFYIDYL